jgi:mRNA-degrading endonuclease RelE of RelBE toxin-antitoxin system
VSWVCKLTDVAESDLQDLPRGVQQRVARTISQMETAPFQGDVKALKGKEWRGVFRRRIGAYRIMFSVDQKNTMVTVVRIQLRSVSTYR